MTNYKIGDRIRIVEMGNAEDSHLNGNEGAVVGVFGPFVDVHLDNNDKNLFEESEYGVKYVITMPSEIEKI